MLKLKHVKNKKSEQTVSGTNLASENSEAPSPVEPVEGGGEHGGHQEQADQVEQDHLASLHRRPLAREHRKGRRQVQNERGDGDDQVGGPDHDVVRSPLVVDLRRVVVRKQEVVDGVVGRAVAASWAVSCVTL